MKMAAYLILAWLSTNTQAYFDYQANAASEMNGIKFAEHLNFATKWKLVTVRFREDSNEMRFTYANDLAWEALKALRPNYPDGAKFGKVSYFAEGDPAFPSSKVPGGVTRYQLMVKNRKAYKNTDGWGYALFSPQGGLFNEPVEQKTMACVTCHRIVPERDFVFSRNLDRDSRDPRDRVAKNAARTQILFKGKTPEDFPATLRQLLTKNEAIESLEGPLQQHAFSGTLDEVVPLLLERVKLTGKTSLLAVNEKNFSVVQIPAASKSCNDGKGKTVTIVIHYNGGKVRDAEHCLN